MNALWNLLGGLAVFLIVLYVMFMVFDLIERVS